MVELMKTNEDIVAITPAMLSGSQLIKAKENFPNRVLDVGIAEQNSVTLAAGLATQGKLAYCTIYSTFLQRVFDQVIYDVFFLNLTYVFCIVHVGFVGTDCDNLEVYIYIVFMYYIT